MVVANAVAALAEIHEVSGKDVFQITSQSLFKLLRALNECTEWGQVKLLTHTLAATQCPYSKYALCMSEHFHSYFSVGPSMFHIDVLAYENHVHVECMREPSQCRVWLVRMSECPPHAIDGPASAYLVLLKLYICVSCVKLLTVKRSLAGPGVHSRQPCNIQAP